ncbi:hypothetical protein TNCV_1804491 [Trichonephila clavipes]|nr:hypothetical protein TNCV_1804491 [Trichonephila clavipes]
MLNDDKIVIYVQVESDPVDDEDENSNNNKSSKGPSNVYVTLGPDVLEQMFRSGGQSDAKPQVLSSRASLALIYLLTERDEKLSRPCPVQSVNLGPVVRKCDAPPLSHWA